MQPLKRYASSLAARDKNIHPRQPGDVQSFPRVCWRLRNSLIILIGTICFALHLEGVLAEIRPTFDNTAAQSSAEAIQAFKSNLKRFPRSLAGRKINYSKQVELFFLYPLLGFVSFLPIPNKLWNVFFFPSSTFHHPKHECASTSKEIREKNIYGLHFIYYIIQ